MLKDMKRILAASALVAVLLLPASVFARLQGEAPAKEKAEEKAESREPHPAIRAAMKHLQEAKNILQNKAASDFGGHKVEAIKSIDTWSTCVKPCKQTKSKLNVSLQRCGSPRLETEQARSVQYHNQRPSGFVEGRSHRSRQSLLNVVD